jgi:aldehyde dehydrogenase (NAD+)
LIETKTLILLIFASNTCYMEFLQQLRLNELNKGVSTGTHWINSTGEPFPSSSPVDGKQIGRVIATDRTAYELVVDQSMLAAKVWAKWPAPKRGEIVRQVGEALRAYKEPLGKLVSYEMGKSLQEGYGEVQ